MLPAQDLVHSHFHIPIRATSPVQVQTILQGKKVNYEEQPHIFLVLPSVDECHSALALLVQTVNGYHLLG